MLYNVLIIFINQHQHPHVDTFKIDRNGVFKIGKNFKKKEGKAIQSFGDEKLVVEGDFYKPSLRGSPFYNGDSLPVRFINSSGINHDRRSV